MLDVWMDAYLAYLDARDNHERALDCLESAVGRGQSARLSGTVSPSSHQVWSGDTEMEGGSQASPSSLFTEGSGVSLGPTRNRQVHQSHH